MRRAVHPAPPSSTSYPLFRRFWDWARLTPGLLLLHGGAVDADATIPKGKRPSPQPVVRKAPGLPLDGGPPRVVEPGPPPPRKAPTPPKRRPPMPLMGDMVDVVPPTPPPRDARPAPQPQKPSPAPLPPPRETKDPPPDVLGKWGRPLLLHRHGPEEPCHVAADQDLA